jgi:GT2 family glycosyltransferase
MEAVDIIIPSKGEKHLLECLKSLRFIPFPYKLYLVMEGSGWPEAVNIGFRQSKNDVILMDDDVRILPGTFTDFERYLPYADIFGFKLLYENGTVQHGGALITPQDMRHRSEKWGDNTTFPAYMSHVTTSLCYIKRKVINNIKIAEDYPGYQFEDVDFNFRAIDAGYKILYVPNKAIHYETLTKNKFADFFEKNNLNYEELKKRHDFSKYVGIQPFQFN